MPKIKTENVGKLQCSSSFATKVRAKLKEYQNNETNLKLEIEKHIEENNMLQEYLKQKNEKIAELTERNNALQTRVISGMDEMRDLIQDFRSKQNYVHHQENDGALFKVGYRRSTDNTIHLGRDIWLPCQIYDSASYNCKTPATFLKSLAICIFGIETLKSSSVTGIVSNRIRNKTTAVARPQLDINKLCALKDIYAYWLKHVKHYDEVAIELEVTQVGSHLSHKICELNRPKRTSSQHIVYSKLYADEEDIEEILNEAIENYGEDTDDEK